MTRCKANLWGFGHRFEARYDHKPPAMPPGVTPIVDAQTLVNTIVALTARTYVRDVCARCGHAIERKAIKS